MFLEIILTLLTAALPMSAPLILVGLGEMFNQRSGQFNLGAEGIMLLGAFIAYWLDLHYQLPWLGVMAALIVGGLMGLCMAIVSVSLKAEQGIAGIGLYLVGFGVASTLFRVYVGGIKPIVGIKPLSITSGAMAWLSQIPWVSELTTFFSLDALLARPWFSGLEAMLFQLNPMDYLTLILIPTSSWLLYKTTWGLKVRAVGTLPQAVDSLGISVTAIRYQCLILSGMLAGVAGAYLSLCSARIFADNLIAGRGFIAVALVYFGRWTPWGISGGAFLFSIASALQRTIQVYGLDFPYELALMLPYALVIVVLAISRSNKNSEPAALGQPYFRER